jgi:hypothetical protein
MRKMFLLLLLCTSSCSHISVVDYSQDLYWHNLVLEMQTTNKPLGVTLQQSSKHLLDQIKSDANDPVLLSFWGESLNFDSGAKKKIIEDKVLIELQNYFHLKSDNHIVHAGVTHSYGYLFSNLDTPYGYKRKRWIDPEVNRAFGLAGMSLSPETKEGTLLSNITFFAGKIAFQNEESQIFLNKLLNVSSEVKSFDFKKLKVKILEEKIETPSNIQKIIRTHFVHFENKNDQNEYLLIYTIEDLNNHTEKLITVFPINKDSYLKTTDPLLMGADRPILPKYNMYLSAGKDVRFSGHRVVK